MNSFLKQSLAALVLLTVVSVSADAQRRRVGDPGEVQFQTVAQDESVTHAKDLIKQNKADEAMSVLNGAAAANEKNADWFATRGSIYLSKKQYKEAEADLNKALQLDAKHAYAHYYMGMTQSGLKRTDQMVKHFEMFLQLAPNAPEATRVKSLMRSI